MLSCRAHLLCCSAAAQLWPGRLHLLVEYALVLVMCRLSAAAHTDPCQWDANPSEFPPEAASVAQVPKFLICLITLLYNSRSLQSNLQVLLPGLSEVFCQVLYVFCTALLRDSRSKLSNNLTRAGCAPRLSECCWSRACLPATSRDLSCSSYSFRMLMCLTLTSVYPATPRHLIRSANHLTTKPKILCSCCGKQGCWTNSSYPQRQ